MNADGARDLLVAARKAIDEAGRRIVEDYKEREEKTERAFEERINDEREKIRTEIHVRLKRTLERVEAALDQWEISEPHPLQDDRSFMDNLRILFREIADFDI